MVVLLGIFFGIAYSGYIINVIGFDTTKDIIGEKNNTFNAGTTYKSQTLGEVDWQNILGNLFSMDNSPDGNYPGLENR